jgi:hypothetical protein
MTTTPEAVRARRYLLGEATDAECSVIEQEYFERDEAIDRIAAVEDDLIEDYLAGDLTPAERARFERVYLSVPQHRVRVETIRRLLARASRGGASSPQKGKVLPWPRVSRQGGWLALAASLLVVASVGLWLFPRLANRQPAIVENRVPASTPATGERPPSAPQQAPQVYALTLSPVAVRSSSESISVAIPPGTDVVAIRLESDTGNRRLVAQRASIRIVGGDMVWEGSVTAETNRPAGTVARVEVPAARLQADDYLVTLFGTDQAGVEREWTQYYLRVRDR